MGGIVTAMAAFDGAAGGGDFLVVWALNAAKPRATVNVVKYNRRIL